MDSRFVLKQLGGGREFHCCFWKVKAEAKGQVGRRSRLSLNLDLDLSLLRRGGGFPLGAIWSGRGSELVLNGLQFLPEGFHFRSILIDAIPESLDFCLALRQGFCRLSRGVGYTLRRSLSNGGYRRMLEQLIIDGEKPVGRLSSWRRIKAIG